MPSTVLYMSVSLDGFVAGPNETVDNPLGDGGERLHDWLLDDAVSGAEPDLALLNAQVFAESMRTGAVVAGRGTAEPAGFWNGDNHGGVPCFVLTRQDSARLPSFPLITYLPDIVDAVERARAAAGERDVLLHGVGTARAALAAGLLDEVQLHVVPVLLGQGRRLFEGLPARQVDLEPVRVVSGEDGMTHLRYRVLRDAPRRGATGPGWRPA